MLLQSILFQYITVIIDFSLGFNWSGWVRSGRAFLLLAVKLLLTVMRLLTLRFRCFWQEALNRACERLAVSKDPIKICSISL